MAIVKKKIAKACKGVSYPKPSSVSANLKKGGSVSKYKKGGTVKKAQRGASAISSQSNCKGGDCKKSAEELGNKARGAAGLFEKMRESAELRRWNKASRAEFDKEYAKRDTSGAAARSAKFREEERGRAEDVALADRLSAQRNKLYPYRESSRIYDSLQAVRRARPAVGPTMSGSAEGKETGEYIKGEYRTGGKVKKSGSKLVKKASSRSMKSGGMIKKSAVKKAVVKKTIKVKSKKK